MLETKAYQRKPFIVQAVQVTLENMPAVVAWCGGNLRRDELHRPYIKVEVHRAANAKQTMAYEGDWVLISNTGARVYTDYAFNKSFEEMAVDPYQKPQQNVFDLPGVDRAEVVEKPVGDEKLIQGESVETVVNHPSPGVTDVRRTPFSRTPEQIREAHRTGRPMSDLALSLEQAYTRSDGSPVPLEELDPRNVIDSSGRVIDVTKSPTDFEEQSLRLHEEWVREQRHQPAANVDDTP